jgi:TolB protein
VRKLALPVVLAAVAVAATPASSSPRHSPASNGWIVFTSDRDVNSVAPFRLYRLEPIGGRVTPIGQLRGRQPAWSPDGSLIAYVDDRFRLAVARSDGRLVRTLPTGGFPVRDPAWSPDGSRIAFTRFTRRRAAGDIAIVAADGSGTTRITRTWQDDSEPAWSPDGSRLAFASNRDAGGIADRELYLVRPNGRELRRLTSNVYEDRSPAWAPNASVIAFVSGRTDGRFNPELWTIGLDDHIERRVQQAAGPNGFPSWSDESPAWSPDGNWLVYVTNQTYYPENVFIVRPDGSDKIDLTPETRSQDLDPTWQPVCSAPGTPGADTLRGTGLDDRLCGFGGNDMINGGAGVDGLYGGDGNDTLRSRDRSFDIVGCGPGRDDVLADLRDHVGVDCERVRRR